MTAHVRVRPGLTLVVLVVAALARGDAACADGVVVEDESVRMKVPSAWTVSGEAGEYWLESDQDVASLLLLPPDPDMTLDVRLAEIEKQFLSTGVIHLEASETRPASPKTGEVVHYRRYRLTAGPDVDTASIVLHEYVFVRSGVRVLLQVETPPEGGGPEELFRAIFDSLEVRVAPDPFEVDVPFSDDTLSAPEDGLGD